MERSRELITGADEGAAALAVRFTPYQRLTVRQRKRWLEILLSFEMKNSYDVYDDQQMPVLRVREEGSGFLSLIKRLFLGPLRPFSATVLDLGTQASVLLLRRPFRFFFHRLEVARGDGSSLGAIQRRWAWFRRNYDIEDASGHVAATIVGPFLRPWTFQVMVDGREVGTIRKRWSGFLKEMFTDADNFGVDLVAVDDPELKARALAATVLIDVVHFERAKGN
jgi:uncharacterized protein YxjI